LDDEDKHDARPVSRQVGELEGRGAHGSYSQRRRVEDQRNPLVVAQPSMSDKQSSTESGWRPQGGGMKQRIFIIVLLFLALAGSLKAHDLFLKLDSYFVVPGSTLLVQVLNGTFNASEGAVAKDRVRDIAVVTPAGRTRLDTSAWTVHGDTSVLTVSTGESGTYVIGASLRPRELKLEAKDFNDYLAHDGVPDVLETRRKARELDRPARERYSKHVKALVQVGNRPTKGYQAVLGYPAELIPLDNPYNLTPGGMLRVRATVEGQPLANQLVIAGGSTGQQSMRTDSSGVARVRIASRGAWYVKFIHMRPAAGDTTIDYESKWATLTFGVR
jgi:uncharacterized GH25 family protein